MRQREQRRVVQREQFIGTVRKLQSRDIGDGLPANFRMQATARGRRLASTGGWYAPAAPDAER